MLPSNSTCRSLGGTYGRCIPLWDEAQSSRSWELCCLDNCQSANDVIENCRRDISNLDERAFLTLHYYWSDLPLLFRENVREKQL